MKLRLNKNPESAIALVITLVMLAIVTVMAVVFLGVSRRERASVKVGEDIATANSMADAAGERAKAEAIAKMAAAGSKLYYDLFNSRSFDNPNGFNSGAQTPTSPAQPQNVSYLDRNGRLLTGQAYLRMLANMQYDARVPVFIETNATTGANEFRYYLDFDRNRQIETNGIVPVVDANGRQLTVKNPITGKNDLQFANLVGDPEWIGVLEKPDLPHSETNRFIGRLAYLVLPAGKTLDLNFIHNQANPSAQDRIDVLTGNNGFTRNQGVGSWEINLAAFFRELDTNDWVRTAYTYRPGQLPTGAAFDDARSFLAFRYNTRRFLTPGLSALSSPENPLTGAQSAALALQVASNGIDDYGDGPFPNAAIFRKTAKLDNDSAANPWPASFTTNAFTDLQQVFSIGSPAFTNRLQAPLKRRSTADRYSFYRLAAQLGADSTPALDGKLHLNFVNPVGKITNNIVPWSDVRVSPLAFFTNAADLMLKSSFDGVVTVASNRNDVLRWGRAPGTYFLVGDTLVSTNFSLTNIQVYSPYRASATATNFPVLHQNEYSSAIHRILQVAVNLYDNMTNRGPALDRARGIYYPTVLRPVYTKTPTNIYISGWEEVTNVTSQVFNVRQITNSIADLLTDKTVPINRPLTNSSAALFGEHLIVGAKKGHPNFNELTLQTTAEIARKLEVIKPSAGAPPNKTNEMFIVSLDQRWGMEAWNSYTNRYTHPVNVLAEIQTITAVKDTTNLAQLPIAVFNRRIATTPFLQTNNWAGFTNFNTANFAVVLSNNASLLPDIAYTRPPGSAIGRLQSTNLAQFTAGIQLAPYLVVTTTNKVRYLMWDKNNGRIIDYVSFDNLVVNTDIGSQLYAPPTASTSLTRGPAGNNEDLYWDPTPVGNGPLTRGITNQLAAAAGDLPTSAAIWKAFRMSTLVRTSSKSTPEDDKNGAIAAWRKFLGLKLLADLPPVPPSTSLTNQIPFVPSRRIEQTVSWQVNDPLVHYMAADIAPDPREAAPHKGVLFNQSTQQPAQTAPPIWNIGALNTGLRGYNPWGGLPSKQPDALTFSPGVKDAGIRRSDDWEFPIDDVLNQQTHTFATIGEMGRVHRGTPWQTIYFKSIYTNALSRTGLVAVPLPGTFPSDWLRWAGSVGTHPMNDWKLLDVFTTAAHENATRGLLSVNQTNREAWSAVLSGVIVPTNTTKQADIRALAGFQGVDPEKAYIASVIEPATPQVQSIVESINWSRQQQVSIVPNPNLNANPNQPWIFVPKVNPITGHTNNVFEHLGDVLGAPALSVQSPYLNTSSSDQMKSVMTDRAMEYIPQQILSLLQRDQPRFVVYAFGQSLKPAPRSLTSNPNFYHMCTNYQITGEVTTKTVFHVEGELPVKGNPYTQNKPLRAVVESFEILPPVE